jgi:Zn-dependent alcohol dehydrogenase
MAGHPSYGERSQLDQFDLIQGRKVKGSWGGGAPDKDIPTYIKYYKNGKFHLERMILQVYPLGFCAILNCLNIFLKLLL